jgi:hypothetical protein
MPTLTSDARNQLKSSQFALPGSRRFPIPDKAHAAVAKGRATQMVKRGKLSAASAAKIRAKANAKLGNPGVTQDLNAPGNRSPLTPNQEDINNWKSRPVTTRGKFMANSQGKGAAADSGAGTNFKSQPKFGGTQVASASKKAQAKVSGGTEAPSKRNLKQPKFGGTANPQSAANGSRYANGSGSHDNMRTVIRDH